MYIVENITNEIEIKKSKFITIVNTINSEEEVNSMINDIKKTYKNATHYCFAYIIDSIERFNDDGEPSGTAGVPLLNILKKEELNHTICIVVRYFGGIKLGTGGLIRAYSKSLITALKLTNKKELKTYINISIEFIYSNIKSIDFILKDEIISSKEFKENIIYNISIEQKNYLILKKKLEKKCLTFEAK